MDDGRVDVGVWYEVPPGSRWANEGVPRQFGLIIEGAALIGRHRLVVCVPTGMAEAVRADYRALAAEEGVDWIAVEPPPDFRPIVSERADRLRQELEIGELFFTQAVWANAHLNVAGWLVSFPNFAGAHLLSARKAVLMPDALPFDFPLGWALSEHWLTEEGWTGWKRRASRMLRLSEAVITFSRHVTRRHAIGLLGARPKSIRLIPHPPPDLGPILPFIKGRRKTAASVARAAEMLRAHAVERRWTYLSDFPFEEVPYVVASTRDRVTKNLGTAAIAIGRLVRRDHLSVKLITTAAFETEDWTMLPRVVCREGLGVDVISVPDLPRPVHAALYHCAAAAIHPSLFEGGTCPFPFYEAVSVGTPCLISGGHNLDELIEDEPDLAPWRFDPTNPDDLAKKLSVLLADPAAVLDVQARSYNRMSARTWRHAAEAYCAAALGEDIPATDSA